MVARVGGIMAPAALDAVRAAAGFPGPWEEIASTLEELRACLLNPSCHPCLANNKALCCEVLQSVADTVARATDIAGRCREPLTAGNKKLESAIRELPWQLDVSLWDCEVLVKVGELYYEDENNASSPPPLVDATSSSSCVDVRELQRLLAWMEISHTDGKNLALDGILEALHKDETRVVSMFDRDNVSALVSLLSALSPEAVREKAATVLSYVVASHDWLVESEDALRRLIRLLMSGSQKAAITLHHLMSLSNSSSSTTARAIMWYGAFGPLIEMCRQTGVDSEAQSAAAGMLNNICVMPDFRQELADDGIVRVMVGLLHRGDAVPESKEHAAECLEKFTSNTSDGSLRRAVVSQGGLRALLLYLRDNEEAAVNAIRNLVDVISTTSGSSADDDTATMKRLAGEQGCVPLLVRTIQEEGNSNSVREVAVEMLASLATYPPNAREMDVDDKCVPALVQLLDPGPHTNTANRHAVQCLLLLASTNKRCRNLMISHGANEHLRKLSDMNVAGATELLHRLEGGWLRSLFH
ncbi:hypothetical protein PR202_gb13401 [Eleusine coracana subsp. coracana]|uniref:DUF7032 domain-containing protein n=1 Tax=Eleusine coracana subsp. coracana TaxID=191504 RepID=A0AAV5ESS2_ELECO|nr:hypothetical protein QOZ80_9BG0714480 [Eleusine coracana subsp. coracana]GJN25557.1 hypothetical protein PR202_gb13401 [Eleusine coracana subsp. coracana]